MKVDIKANSKSYFNVIFKIINSFYSLRSTEIEIIKDLMILYYDNKDNKDIERLLLSTSVRKMLRKKLGIKEATFNNYISSLMKQGYIEKTTEGRYTIGKKMMSYIPQDEKFEITFNFKLK